MKVRRYIAGHIKRADQSYSRNQKEHPGTQNVGFKELSQTGEPRWRKLPNVFFLISLQCDGNHAKQLETPPRIISWEEK